ncbi:MAG: hypothetical protein QNJ61_10045 [Desulfobacterales bacterium]|nr:hypothetical protein [Desulfobacterales bacterium]
MADPCEAFAPLENLDPELARRLHTACRRAATPPPDGLCREIVATLIECFGREVHFGQAVADGYCDLLALAPPEALSVYGEAVRRDGRHGAGRGRATAVFMVPVLLTDDASLLAAYRRTVDVLLAKGAYLLPAPLEGLRWLLAQKDRLAADAYLTLLQDVFDRHLSYNRCQYLGNLLPRALRRMPPRRRGGQLRQLARVAAADLRLLEPFLEGLDRGLSLLSAQTLERFSDQALTLAQTHFERAVRFIALRSERGRESCQGLQTAVPLTRVMAGLNRYLQARTGGPVSLKPLATLPGITDAERLGGPRCACDGIAVYLPDEIERYASREENARLFRLMAKFEVALIEYGTFRFDLERARDLGLTESMPMVPDRDDAPAAGGDLAYFLDGFGHRRLALDLLTLFEHARLRVRLAIDYPGLVRQGLPVFQEEYRARQAARRDPHFLEGAYAHLALTLPLEDVRFDLSDGVPLLRRMQAAFRAAAPSRMPVEASAGLAADFYPTVADRLAVGRHPFRPLGAPFRQPIDTAAYAKAFGEQVPRAAVIARRLAARGFKLYQADLRQALQRNAGRLDDEDLRELVRQARETDHSGGLPPAAVAGLEPADWEALDPAGAEAAIDDPEDVEAVVWLREWNQLIGDYLHDHVRVRDRRLAAASNGFYAAVLERHQGLVRRLKYAFELLRPEGLKLLRQWVEGDDFDYRALLDYAMDRRAGIMPSDRLYLKRIKQRRDVAVLLLVDLSRSTSNIVDGSSASVLDVEKEAIVLFSQALEVVGDRYAIAGFSGTGRLGVDYFRIKDFDAPLSEAVRGGIGRLRPQRSTRMGAAVRRAARDLLALDARVRLLIVIGDGFPNDLAYKQDYAIADTRQAIGEARAQRIFTHAITVNLPASPRLDDLYGHVHHTVISDVQELPDQLLRIYSALTRG